MSQHARDALTRGLLCAVTLAAIIATPVRAEFPPEGAISDPSNPSVASGDYPDPAHNGVTRHYIFYFDCGKRDWIGVSVADTKGTQAVPPQAVGKGREFPSGPPPGSKVDASNLSRASVAGSGQTFSLRRGVWFDTKTGKPVASSKLCPESAPQHAVDREQSPSPARSEQQRPATLRGDPKPDQLPPPPQYLSAPTARSHP